MSEETFDNVNGNIFLKNYLLLSTGHRMQSNVNGTIKAPLFSWLINNIRTEKKKIGKCLVTELIVLSAIKINNQKKHTKVEHVTGLFSADGTS